MSFLDYLFGLDVREQLNRIESKLDLENLNMADLTSEVADLKAALSELIGKVDTILNNIASAQTLADVQALVDAAKAETAKVDAVLNPPPPPTP
jgi:ABC-type transporter Mla subunit MlaD